MSSPADYSRRIVIIGSGFAGAATAWALMRHGAHDVTVLERESIAGTHASGRNAAMIRQVVAPTSAARLARTASTMLRGELAGPARFRRTGSILLGDHSALARLADLQPERYRNDVAVVPLDEMSGLPSTLRGARAAAAIITPDDGVVDAGALLAYYIDQARRRGTTFIYGCDVQRLDRVGSSTEVVTNRGRWSADLIVNAAGAWAGRIAALAGATPLPVESFRRHLFYSGAVSGVRADDPFVWDVSGELYFRPESSGYLLSACDHDPAAPSDPPIESRIVDELAAKLARHIPALEGLPIARTWAGLRTFAPDGAFLIGPDPRLPSFHWVAALGGHGVTTSPALGEAAARAILGGAVDADYAPSRLLAGASEAAAP